MKVVLDTNVLLAAFSARGMCEAVLAVCLNAHDLHVSEYILDEVQRNLTAKFKMPEPRSRQIVDFLRQRAQVVVPVPVTADSCEDKDDLPVLGTLLAAGADCLVTGDRDLLKLKTFQGISILSPRTFYDRLRSGTP